MELVPGLQARFQKSLPLLFRPSTFDEEIQTPRSGFSVIALSESCILVYLYLLLI